MAKRIVLAYSGGLDTSVLVRWMTEETGAEVIALAVDLGQGGDWEAVRARAVAAGAAEVEVADAKREFASDFVAPAISANALYEGKYPLISSLSRPVIVKYLVDAARRHGADAIAHGCTGKGNDQVRFEVSTPRSGARPGGPGSGADLGLHSRRLDRLRPSLGHPCQRHQGQSVLGRPKPVGPYGRMWRP